MCGRLERGSWMSCKVVSAIMRFKAWSNQCPLLLCRQKANAGVLTNFEVLDFLRSRGAKIDPMGCLGAVAVSECKVYEYILKTPACNQTRESIYEFVKRSEGFRLAEADKLNVINWRPSSTADAYAMIEECGKRFSRDERGEACDEDERVQEFLDMVKEVLPAPPKAEVETAEAEAEAGVEAMQE
ncbi:DNA-directed RNA polymerase III subunit RPC9 [Zea mays]|uniref:DNA-directed RNA polymerase III subunit RPC9 n=1 Tax=Zea mays TaxID=4577 RepID=A0A3L6FUP3_MAIZE|nr:DNA-directed RNA polymerase III subunit RPC9 [Zea mays]